VFKGLTKSIEWSRKMDVLWVYHFCTCSMSHKNHGLCTRDHTL